MGRLANADLRAELGVFQLPSMPDMSNGTASSKQSDSSRPRPLRIGLIAGEISGDQLGGQIVSAIRNVRTDTEFLGLTGPEMELQGVRSIARIEELSVMGLVEVLRQYPRLLALQRRVREAFEDWVPDVVLGIDVPDFNLGLLKALKSEGCLTAQLVCPQAWAWREKRAYRLHQSIDLLLALFPFEKAFFSSRGMPTEFVGHPLADRLPAPRAREDISKSDMPDAPQITRIAILPGSRPQEIRRILPTFLEAVSILSSRHSNVALTLCVADRAHIDILAGVCALRENLDVVAGKSLEVLSACDLALVASGTAALEALLCGAPMVVGYRMNPITFSLLKRMVKLKHISLPNILAGSALVPELLQDDLRPLKLADSLDQWLIEPQRREVYLEAARRIHGELRCDAAAKVARSILGLVVKKTQECTPVLEQ